MLIKVKKSYLIILILIIGLAIRFYNFPQRLIYGPEQARSLLVAARNLTEKPSLLGQEYFRFTTDGHQLFYSALFTYSLIPFEIIFKYNPVLITAYFTLLNVFTGFLIYFLGKKIVDERVAIVSMIIFLFNSEMIYHSLFIWQYNYLPLIGLLSLYLLFLFKKNPRLLYVLMLGIFSGVGIGLQYLFAVYILVILGVLMVFSGKRVKNFLVFWAGFLIGDWPMVFFDLRNHFYHITTLLQYFLDTLRGQSDASFNYYYLLPLWTLAAILIGFYWNKIYLRKRQLAFILLLTYFGLDLSLGRVNLNKSLGMPEGLSWSEIQKASEVIVKENPIDFNVVTLLDFDTRAYLLRYPLEAIYRIKPMGVEDYPNSKIIYSLSELGYDYTNPQVWELQSIYPYDVEFLGKVNENHGVFKLTKK